jgi:hypothetical protein
MAIKKMPSGEGRPLSRKWRMMLARHWMNELRSNTWPLELSKLDIVSTSNNLWVRWATFIGISLFLFHRPWFKGSNAPFVVKKGHHFKVCLRQYTLCVHCEHYDHYPNNCPMKKLTPSELEMWLLKRQFIDDSLSQAMGHCSHMEPLQILNSERIHILLGLWQDPDNWITTNSLHLFFLHLCGTQPMLQ